MVAVDQILIVRRAFELVKRYRVLWLLGILVAITAGGGSGGNGRFMFGPEGPFHKLRPEQVALLIGALVGVLCLVFVLVIAALVVRYVARTGLIHAVDQIEEGGQPPTLRQALRLGWRWQAVRLFLIDLVITIPLAVVLVSLFLFALSPLLLLLIDSQAVRIFAILLMIGLILLAILLTVVTIALVSLLRQFMWRAAVLDDQNVSAAIGQGIRLVRAHLQDVGLLWLLMLGIGLAYGLLMIPVLLLLLVLGLVMGGGPAWLIYQVTGWPILAAVIGVPIFLATVIIPVAVISGFYEAFKSAAWTLAYRDVRTLDLAAV